MGTNLVACCHNLASKGGLRLGDFAKNKERSTNSCFIEQFQQRTGIGHNPIPDGQGMIERRLRPVFNVHG
jgi:hypothetical protein